MCNVNADGTPLQVAYKSMNAGRIFTLQFNNNKADPFTLACGGDKGLVAVWECDEMEVIRNHFSARQSSL